MRRAAVVLSGCLTVLACSHDWSITGDDGHLDAGGLPGETSTSSPDASSSSSSSTSSSSSSGQPPEPRACPPDCSCSAGETCAFRCTGDCTIDCQARATCQVEATAGCTVKNDGVTTDCSSGSYSCKTSPNGKDIQCQKL